MSDNIDGFVLIEDNFERNDVKFTPFYIEDNCFVKYVQTNC